MATSAVSSVTGTTPVAATTTNAEAAGDRFLKLLVTQMQNQDPLNPMDNAQVTSQMAQIQSVSGIEKLNTTVLGLNAQFAQLQALSGAGLVGRDVLVEGSRLAIGDDGLGHAGLELATPSDTTKVEILSGAGRVLDTVELGALGAGRHTFEWTPPPGVDASLATTFRASAKLGATSVATTALARDRVDAVSSGADGLTLELAHAGPVTYDKVKVFD
jgi:flagellar basal-body rod modification protein FlgD